MAPIRQYLQRRMSVRDAVLVVIGAAVLGGFGYAGFEFVTERLLKARVTAALPRVTGEVCRQRDELVRAIEAYKAHFGFYPPDHVFGRSPRMVEPVTNSLYYELFGTVYNPTNETYQVGHGERANAPFVREFLKCQGFTNCAENPDGIRCFLPAERRSSRQLHEDPDVFVIGVEIPFEGVTPDVQFEFDFSSWRYVASSATHNPGRFDLWAEISAQGQTVIVGNW